MRGSARRAPKVRCATSARITTGACGSTVPCAAVAARSSEIRPGRRRSRPRRGHRACRPDLPGPRTSVRRPAGVRPSLRRNRISARRPPRRAGPEEPAEPEVLPRTPSLGELLEEITEERARGRARYEVDDTVGEAAGGASSARVPPCRLSRQNCGPRVPADRRCDHLLISIVRRLHRQLSSVCGYPGPEVASVPAEVIHGGARQGVGYWRLLRDQGS